MVAGSTRRRRAFDVLRGAQWGAHLCQFYSSQEDLLEVLVPYFRCGLENNQFCMWITSGPLKVEHAQQALRQAVRNFDFYLKRRQMRIVPHTNWYVRNGAFDRKRVLRGWISELNEALASGYAGMRVAGDAAWLDKRNWKAFLEYEQSINSTIGGHRMSAICTYPLSKCDALKTLEVANCHQSVFVKQRGKWLDMRNSEVDLSQAKLREKDAVLREVLSQIESEKLRTRKEIGANVEIILMPILAKLRLKSTAVEERYLQILESSLRDLGSAFGHLINAPSYQLSAREIEICNMIRNNLASQEIANLLHISIRTVETHRKSIRKKLDISKKRINLATFLHSIG